METMDRLLEKTGVESRALFHRSLFPPCPGAEVRELVACDHENTVTLVST